MRRQSRTATPLETNSATDAPEGEPQWIAHSTHERIEDRTLSASALAWLASLPRNLYPSHLVERYPRVCNCMAVLWQEPKLMISYFEDLLVDQRGMQCGFPSSIASEIARLKEHFHLNLASAEIAACAAT